MQRGSQYGFVQIRITIVYFLVFITRFLMEWVMLPLCSRELARAVMNASKLAATQRHEYLSETVMFQLDGILAQPSLG
jgi:hypothetical protein